MTGFILTLLSGLLAIAGGVQAENTGSATVLQSGSTESAAGETPAEQATPKRSGETSHADKKPDQGGEKVDAGNAISPAIDAILTRLQQRSDGLRDISCKVRYDELAPLDGSKIQKRGTIRFLLVKPNPLFMIHFDKTAQDGVLGKQEWYLFDGRWLYRALERNETVNIQEIAREGEKLNLFDLEKTPFILPFGHKKDDILFHFDVKLVESKKDDPKDTEHLVFVPHEKSRLARRYAKVDFFIRQGLDLPVRVVITKPGPASIAETIAVDFPDLSKKSINQGLKADGDFRPQKAWADWERSVEKLPPAAKGDSTKKPAEHEPEKGKR